MKGSSPKGRPMKVSPIKPAYIPSPHISRNLFPPTKKHSAMVPGLNSESKSMGKRDADMAEVSSGSTPPEANLTSVATISTRGQCFHNVSIHRHKDGV
eukprot:14624865-Ditylum_brightwellii.AAC.1